jgi:hypothetical protein
MDQTTRFNEDFRLAFRNRTFKFVVVFTLPLLFPCLLHSQEQVIATIAVGNAPFGVGANAATARVYVANQGSDTVSVINSASPSAR